MTGQRFCYFEVDLFFLFTLFFKLLMQLCGGFLKLIGGERGKWTTFHRLGGKLWQTALAFTSCQIERKRPKSKKKKPLVLFTCAGDTRKVKSVGGKQVEEVAPVQKEPDA